MKVGVFHPGTQHSWQTARAVQDLGYLAWYATTIFYAPEKWPYKIENWLPPALNSKVHSEFMRFYHSSLDPKLVRRCGYHEWLERVAMRFGFRDLASRLNYDGNVDFGRRLTRLSRNEPVDLIWGYDSSSFEAFDQAKRDGIRRVLDVTIGSRRVYKRIMTEAYAQYPDFFIEHRSFDIDSEATDRLDREIELADVILAGSEFCRRTLIDPSASPGAAKKIKVLNYCFDGNVFPINTSGRPRPVTRPIRFLFVGQVGPRKGMHLLLESFKSIPRTAASLTILGPMQIPSPIFSRYADRVRYHPNVTRTHVARYMAEADCLILPSLFEGSSLVLLEALASGLGIIQSANSGDAATPDTGIILEDITVEALHGAIMRVVENPALLEKWQSNAPRRAADFTFEKYKAGIKNVLNDMPA